MWFVPLTIDSSVENNAYATLRIMYNESGVTIDSTWKSVNVFMPIDITFTLGQTRTRNYASTTGFILTFNVPVEISASDISIEKTGGVALTPGFIGTVSKYNASGTQWLVNINTSFDDGDQYEVEVSVGDAAGRLSASGSEDERVVSPRFRKSTVLKDINIEVSFVVGQVGGVAGNQSSDAIEIILTAEDSAMLKRAVEH